jgi:hypothetical protein
MQRDDRTSTSKEECEADPGQDVPRVIAIKALAAIKRINLPFFGATESYFMPQAIYTRSTP